MYLNTYINYDDTKNETEADTFNVDDAWAFFHADRGVFYIRKKRPGDEIQVAKESPKA